jgi:hypothetical protein
MSMGTQKNGEVAQNLLKMIGTDAPIGPDWSRPMASSGDETLISL